MARNDDDVWEAVDSTWGVVKDEINATIERYKDKLVTVSIDRVPECQGAIAALRMLIDLPQRKIKEGKDSGRT